MVEAKTNFPIHLLALQLRTERKVNDMKTSRKRMMCVGEAKRMEEKEKEEDYGKTRCRRRRSKWNMTWRWKKRDEREKNGDRKEKKGKCKKASQFGK
jgi:hypothetical protein